MKKKNTSGARTLELTLQRVPFTATIDNKMRQLRGRTGVTPNVLARYGFCLSLEEGGEPLDPFAAEKPGREINRSTLLAELDGVYVALLRAWVAARSVPCQDDERFNQLFIAHMNRGFELISARMRSLSDLANLVSREIQGQHA